MRRARLLLLASVLDLGACGDGGTNPGGLDAGRDGGGGDDGGSTACPRTAAAADRSRFVVVSHPYDIDGNRSGQYEVLELSTSGMLTRPTARRTFTMGRAIEG